MTREEKDLLLKDLCARLPYGIEASVRGSDEECISFEVLGIKGDLVWVRNKMLLVDHFETIEVIKPYLRPMSSMTDEERKEIENIFLQNIQEIFKDPIEIRASRFYDTPALDWFLKKHFDYRKLIEKGLALEAPEGMYEKGGNK